MMAKMIENTLEPVGSRCSSSTGCPLPKYSHIDYVQGGAKFELTDKEWKELANGSEDELESFVENLVTGNNLLPAGVQSISKWGWILSASGLEVFPHEDAEYETDYE